ncbi:hypothetical protein HETIRDRAFT_329715 [Heterobasidion irregulare TC 32-1]|uniref:Uncharacterized protein n=1 Tax=Heterobasidion irregulare (strain TC 32-1) TaxID=747525 RepID=W4JSB5_HETIT|nr:uncharacterized protein HETIRDRAFT_329715 [Heterobasidion irregulare TC 32-1]ETW75995.1 hypothetical protein HETIRDRAFT_329715 [Heterobasidion irregulare TC 32-1]
MPQAPNGLYYCNCPLQCEGTWQQCSQRTHTQHAPYRYVTLAPSSVFFTDFLDTLPPQEYVNSSTISQGLPEGAPANHRTLALLQRAGSPLELARASLASSIPNHANLAALPSNAPLAIPVQDCTAALVPSKLLLLYKWHDPGSGLASGTVTGPNPLPSSTFCEASSLPGSQFDLGAVCIHDINEIPQYFNHPSMTDNNLPLLPTETHNDFGGDPSGHDLSEGM